MRKHINLMIFIGGLLSTSMLLAQKNSPIQISRIEPASWWVGMKNPELQILVYGNKIAETEVSLAGAKTGKTFANLEGITLKSIEKVENPNYLFINLDLTNAKAGTFHIIFSKGKEKLIKEYTLQNRRKPGEKYTSFGPADAIYLIMPDRFANGNPKNDEIKGMNQGLNRQDPFGRHGGDLLGIEKNLDYIADLGFTAIWLNPFAENNQPHESYHGYAITDFYKADARHGTNEDFKRLVEKAHSKNLKIIMDMVFGHCGSEHWFIKDLPEKSWIHQFPEFTRSNYRLSTIVDPYASNFDKDKMTKGWFDKHMPDLNQNNPRLARYLIQNAIWWIETFEIDGIRTDTHPYPYKEFTARLCKEIFEEYPNFNMVGEVWDRRVWVTAYWQKNSLSRDGYNSYLPSVTDFPLYFSLLESLHEDDNDWDWGMAKIYYTLVQDGLYSNPYQNVIFLDNHDLSRMATSYNRNLKMQKMALAMLATLRGIPQVFYGAEILAEGAGDNHGKLRIDFPGGWEGDKVNAFTKQGLTPEQIDFQEYTKKLFNWRKTAKVVHEGKFMHFVPENSVYVYFRYTDSETLMVINNNHKTEERIVDTKRFVERMNGFSKAYNPLTGEMLNDLSQIKVPAKTCMILELKK
ncbi:MAG: glycoside hydrolase family 13 protein [Microscillaceae bacterium]|nr:glycoside hydrolase family 13 protein [Microscillaceae bacterium]MDW8461804.1 glycoside hydrolase family 13 protein [Cytophagales bacterium]